MVASRNAHKRRISLLKRKTPGEVVFEVLNGMFFLLLAAVTFYPFLYVLYKSLINYRVGSDNIKHIFFDFGAYAYIFKDNDIYTSFLLTVFVVLVSTCLHVFITMLAAYPLSKKHLRGRNGMLIYILFTMLFSGGLIPYYILIRDLGLRNSLLVYIIPGLISGFNIIIVKNFLLSVPQSLEESARIDGASHFGVLFKIYFPLSKPIISTVALWFAVGKWNDWFTGMLYITKPKYYLIQNILQAMLVNNTGINNAMGFGTSEKFMLMESIKMAVIIVATIPIVCVYPFVQKYFIKGVMLGSVKE